MQKKHSTLPFLPSYKGNFSGYPWSTVLRSLFRPPGFEHKITVQASPTLDKRKGSDGASPPASPSIIPRLRAIRREYRPTPVTRQWSTTSEHTRATKLEAQQGQDRRVPSPILIRGRQTAKCIYIIE